MTARATFRQGTLTRAIAAAQAAGLTVVRTEIDPDGRIVLVHDAASAPPRIGGQNSCDRVFD